MSSPPRLGAPIDRVLGTALYDLDLTKDQELWILSDLHLDPREPEEIRCFAGWLQNVPAGAPVLILGDLFEYWSGPKQVRDAAWQDSFELFRSASERGQRIWVLHGNRDFLLGRGFERRTGACVVPGGLLVRRPAGRALLCLHGDELCLNDIGYQRSKQLLRSRKVRLLSQVLPHVLCKRIAGGLRQRSKADVAAKDAATMRPSRRAFAELARVECETLIYGHVHRVARGRWPGDPKGRNYHVLPAFCCGHMGYVRERAGEELRYLIGDEERAWPEDAELGS